MTTETKHPQQAKAFVQFLYTKQAQKIYADNGYRPVVTGVTSSKVTFETPKNLFTIDDLGGWTEVTNKFFDPDQRHRDQDRGQQRRLGQAS